MGLEKKVWILTGNVGQKGEQTGGVRGPPKRLNKKEVGNGWGALQGKWS